MRSLTMWNKTVTLTALLAGLAIISLEALAVEATPTPSEKAAIAAEKTAPGSIAQAFFTTAVEDGAPVDFLSEIENSVSEVFFYTVLEGMAGQTVTHRWKHRGNVMATAEFDVKGDPDKVWSSNQMKPEWTGAWEVEVVDGDGQVIGQRTFAFEAPL